MPDLSRLVGKTCRVVQRHWTHRKLDSSKNPVYGSGMLYRLPLIAALAAAIAGLAPVNVAQAAELMSHLAVYRLTLGRADGATGIMDAQGAMVYRFADTCDGWTAENSTRMRVDYEESSINSQWSFASWEARDGDAYRFRVHQTRNGETVDSLHGVASLGGGGIGKVSFTEPRELAVSLEPTLLPTRHLKELLERAAAGEKHFNRVVFDGSSLENPYEINAVMVELPAAERKAAAQALGLPETRTWRIRLAFYPIRAKSPLPEFELSVRYRDDGVADQLEQIFASFAFNLKVAKFERLPDPGC